MKEKFELGDTIKCIKGYKTLVVGSHYNIKGMGHLDTNCDDEAYGKSGFGFCVEDEYYGRYSGKKDWWNLPHNERIKWYYFTESEMSEYFISYEDEQKLEIRDRKIKQILND
jgi:hypothetical protein